MYEKKEHDWILESLGNPDFTNTDFKDVGLNVNNVSIGSEQMYELSNIIRENPLFLTDGKFDNNKFEQYYNLRLAAYNNLAIDSSDLDLATTVSFYKDNVFAPFKNVRTNPDTIITETFNPDRVSLGFDGFNQLGQAKWTPEELAQMNPIYDPETKKFTKYTAEELLYNDFGRTAVLATWDFNADINGNPTNDPTLMQYYKGQPKINPDTGTYYYEFTDKPTYDKQVLSYWNILTKEKSNFNRYDFFDSDDRKKTVFGSLMRNAVMLLPLALGPEISTLYLGGSLLLGFTSTLATLGKMAIGNSENKTLSQIENFVKTTKFTSSEYAKANVWSAENVLNLAGSTFEFLYSMKWMGEQLPKLFGKKVPMTKEEAIVWEESRTDEIVNKIKELNESEIPILSGRTFEAIVEGGATKQKLIDAAPLLAREELSQLQKNYNAFGEALSKMYMALSFGIETYGEAKALGASDEAATALTLGSIAGQYALLKSHIGNWVFPNRLQKLKTEKIGKLIYAGSDDAVTNLKQQPITENLNFFQKWFTKGKNLALEIYDPATMATEATFKGTLAGGIEMTSFEVLRDITASIYNLANKIAGTDGHMEAFSDGDIGNLLDRYGSTFLGGAMGGLMFAPMRNYKEAKAISNMKYTEALQHFTYLMRENKAHEVINEIRKFKNVGSEKLSELNAKRLPDGSKLYSLGSKTDNLNDLWKDRVIEVLELMERIAVENNLKISDDTLVNNLLKEYRYLAIANSPIIAEFPLKFNTAVTELISAAKDLEDFNKTETKQEQNRTDEKLRENKEVYEQLQKKLEDNVEKYRKEVTKFLDGTYGKEFIKGAVFFASKYASSPFINTFESFALSKSGAEKLSDIAPAELEKLETEYKNSTSIDTILHGLRTFEIFNKINSDKLKKDLGKVNPRILSILLDLQLVYDDWNITGEQIATTNSDAIVLTRILSSAAKQESDLESKPIAEYLEKVQQGFSYTDTESIKLLFGNENFDKIWKPFIESEYLPDVIKDPVLRFVNETNKLLLDYTFTHKITDFDDEPIFVNNEIENSNKLKESILDKPITIVTESIFDIAEKVFGIDGKKIFRTAEDVINNAKSIDDISSSGAFVDLLEKIELAAILYMSPIIAAVKDDANINNPIGFNVTSNKLDGTNLATISYEEANLLLREVNVFRNKANIYREAFIAVENRKQTIHKKIGQQFNIALYKKVSSLLDKIPESWDKSDLVNAFDKFEILKLLETDNITVDPTSEIKFENEILDLELAIFDFFKKNEDKVKNPKLLSEFINANNFSKKATKQSLSGENKTEIDDRTLIGLLATFAATSGKSSKFLVKQVLTSLRGTDAAIMPLRTQEIGARMAIADILNHKVFTYFLQAYNLSLGHTKESTLEEYMFLLSRVLIDAIAGAGKSLAILPLALRAVLIADKKLQNKIAAVHIDSESANGLLLQLGLPGKGYSIEEFMKEHFLDYDIRREKDTGNVQPNENKYYYDDSEIVRYKGEAKAVLEPPTLVIIDEVARLCAEDFDLLNLLEEKYNTKFIIAGDIYQTGIVSNKLYPSLLGMVKPQEGLPASGGYITSMISENSFFTTPRNDISFRNLNTLKDYNLNLIARYVKLFTDASKISIVGRPNDNQLTITLKHHITEQGQILGDKIDTFTKGISELEIQLAIIHAKNHNESIGLIYLSEDSAIYKFITEKLDKELADYVLLNKKKGASAQGRELDYYIIDFLNWNPEDGSDYARQFYTSITRSKKGTLAYLPTTEGTFKKSIDDPNVFLNEPISKETINRSIDEYLDVLNHLDLSDKLELFGVSELKKIEIEIPEEFKLKNEVKEVHLDLDKKNNLEKPIVISTGPIKNTKNFLKKPDGKYRPNEYPFKHSEEIADIATYTAMTHAVGGEIKNINGEDYIELDKQIIKTKDGREIEAWKVRRDGVNGLIKFAEVFGLIDVNNLEQLKKLLKVDFAWEYISQILDACLDADNKSDLIANLTAILKSLARDLGKRIDLDNIYATFGLVGRETVKPWNKNRQHLDTTLNNIANGSINEGFGRFIKSIEDALCKLPFPSENRPRELWSDFRVVIGTEKGGIGDLLEIPILKFLNPETFAQTVIKTMGEKVNPQFKAVHDFVTRKPGNDPNADPVMNIDEINDYLYTEVLEKYDNGQEVPAELLTYAKLYSIWTINNNIFVPITLNDGNWVPRDTFTFIGPRLSLTKGIDYEWKRSGLKFIPKWESISDFLPQSPVTMSNIMVPRRRIELSDGRIIEKGLPVVLIGNLSFKTDKDFIDELLSGNKHKRVNIMWISKPRATADDYLDWLQSSRDSDLDKKDKVGHKFTSFRIFQALKSKFNEKLNNLPNNPLKPLFDELLKIEERVSKLENQGLEEDAFKVLLEDSQIKGHTHQSNELSKTILNWGVFDSFLYDFCFSKKHLPLTTVKNVRNENNRSWLIKLLSEVGFDAFFYDIQLVSRSDRSEADSAFAYVKGIDYNAKKKEDRYYLELSNNAKVPFLMLGKYDTTVARGNITPLINHILQQIWRDTKIGGSAIWKHIDEQFTLNLYVRYQSKLHSKVNKFANPDLANVYTGNIEEALNNDPNIVWLVDDNGLYRVYEAPKENGTVKFHGKLIKTGKTVGGDDIKEGDLIIAESIKATEYSLTANGLEYKLLYINKTGNIESETLEKEGLYDVTEETLTIVNSTLRETPISWNDQSEIPLEIKDAINVIAAKDEMLGEIDFSRKTDDGKITLESITKGLISPEDFIYIQQMENGLEKEAMKKLRDSLMYDKEEFDETMCIFNPLKSK